MPRLFGIFCSVLFLLCFVKMTPAEAASLISVSDTLTTNRPSVSNALSDAVAAGDLSANVVSNGSTFLASDSATLWGGTSETLTVATASASKQKIFFTSGATQAHTAGTYITHAVTAMHTIKFTTATAIPSSGSIVLAFPNALASDTNAASPSGATFMLNSLSGSNIQTNNASCSWTISQTAGGVSKLICTLNSAVNAGTQITMFVGCSAASSTACTSQVPTLINPAKIATAGTADVWKMNITSYSGSSGTGTELDSLIVKLGIVESPTVNAHIDPTFSLTISGVGNGFDMSTVCTDHFTNKDKTNSGIDSTSTQVDLGTLLFTQVNLAAQKMTVTSNAILGYTITATSSGHLLNPSNAAFINDAQGSPIGNDTPDPASITAGTNKFGIHPCDLDTQGKIDPIWGSASNLFANPSPTYLYTIVSSNSAPGSSGDTFYIEYAATPGRTTLPGTYRTTLTYVATTVF